MHTNTEIFINGQPYILDTTYMYLDITIQHLIRGVGHDSLLGGGQVCRYQFVQRIHKTSERKCA